MRAGIGWGFAVASLVLCSGGILCGQDGKIGDDATQPKPMARDADPDWEVATVRPSDPNETRQSFTIKGRHVMILRQSVETMLMVAYGLKQSQITNIPEWARSESFDVDGFPDADGQPSIPQFQTMVRKLLQERFGLKAHLEQREMEVFVLKVAKGGPKLTPTKSSPDALPNQEAHGGEGERRLEFTNVSMQDFALMMLYEVTRPLVDQTGLQGRYDFKLTFTKDEQHAPADGSAAPSLFTAIQEQLGLKLEAVKAPVDVLVVDQIQRPTAN